MNIKNVLIWVFVVIISILSTLFITKSCQNNKYDKLYQNWVAVNDTLEQLQLKNGDLLYEKSVYILKENELNKQLDISNSEIKDLKKKLNSSLAYISELEGSIHIDTIWHTRDSISYIDSTHYFTFNDQYIYIHGYHRDSITTLTDINIPLKLNVGLTDNKQVFATTNNPYVNITSLNGAIIDGSILEPKKSRISHGLTFGLGVGYGIFNKKFDFGPYIGYGLTINF